MSNIYHLLIALCLKLTYNTRERLESRRPQRSVGQTVTQHEPELGQRKVSETVDFPALAEGARQTTRMQGAHRVQVDTCCAVVEFQKLPIGAVEILASLFPALTLRRLPAALILLYTAPRRPKFTVAVL